MVSVNDLNSRRVSYAPLTGSSHHVLQKFEKRDPNDHDKKNSQCKKAGIDLFRHSLAPRDSSVALCSGLGNPRR